MKNDFLKSWKTTLLGLIILAMFIYSVLSGAKAFDVTDVSQLTQVLVAFGFIIGKDSTASHSRDVIGGSIPPKKKKDND